MSGKRFVPYETPHDQPNAGLRAYLPRDWQLQPASVWPWVIAVITFVVGMFLGVVCQGL